MRRTTRRARLAAGLVGGLVLAVAGATADAADPFAHFDLPDAWEATFWADPGTKALLALDAKALAALVPEQAGLRYCRCPACLASEANDTLGWSATKPAVVTCRKCGVSVPDDKYPAKVPPAPGQPPAIPVEKIEVLPRVFHSYPYHAVDADNQAYPDERLYLAAKRDYEAREALAKAALYAAVRHREAGRAPAGGPEDPSSGRLAAVLLVRFAQVYPAYAVHLDQPGEPKVLQPADLPPPYRRGYQSAKWDWSGCLDVPLNLVIAYALLRDDPALDEAGRALGVANPRRLIERDLLLASAEFVRGQPEEEVEATLYAVRGLLAVGRALGDVPLIREAAARLDRFSERCFYYDGTWRQGDGAAQRRVLGLLDGWIDRLLPGEGTVAMVELAHHAAGPAGGGEVRPAAWPAPAAAVRSPAGPALLGGAGIARLGVGRGDGALALELRGLGHRAAGRHDRLALRLAVGGRPALGDLDEQPPRDDGWDRATVSHNTVAVDGLNQRESLDQARMAAPGADILFYAADPDFQVATLDDRQAYPRSTTRYRRTLVAAAGPGGCYAVDLFEVRGGLQHDWFAHAPVGSTARWQSAVPWRHGPRSLLPTTIPYLPNARAEDGRWFVQAYGAFDDLWQAPAERPTTALLAGAGTGPLRVHLLNDAPVMLLSGTAPDPTQASTEGRSSLIVRRSSAEGAGLDTAFVALFEPIAGGVAPLQVGRVASERGTVVLTVRTGDRPEHLVLNASPGTTRTVHLADGRALRTDGLAVRVAGDALTLAGGTFAECGGRRVGRPRVAGRLVAAGRKAQGGSLGWFDGEGRVDDPAALAGRTLLIRHGDGSQRGWTIARAENLGHHRCRLFVREEPGFLLDPEGGHAHYYQFPRGSVAGPHTFRVAQIAR